MARALALLITATGAVHVKELEHLNRSGQEAEKLNRSGEETGNEPCCICSPDKYGDAHHFEPNSIFGCFPCFKVHMEKGKCSFADFEKKVTIEGKNEQGKYKQFQRVRAREWWLFGMEQCEALTEEGEPATKEQEKKLAPPFMHAMCYLPALERFIEEVQRKERLLRMGKKKCGDDFALEYCHEGLDLVEAFKEAEETRKWKYCPSPAYVSKTKLPQPLLSKMYRRAANGRSLSEDEVKEREQEAYLTAKPENGKNEWELVWRRTYFGALSQAYRNLACLEAGYQKTCPERILAKEAKAAMETDLMNAWKYDCVFLEEDDAVAKFRVGLCQKEKCTRFMEGRKPEKTKEQRDGELEAKEAADKVALNRFFGGPKKDLRTDAPAGDSSTK